MGQGTTKPNVVLINCDDLGYGDLGCYGSPLNKTPAIDQLAVEGARFDSFYMASPVCSPSRGALLTGCYPPRIGFGTFEGLPVLFPGQGVGLPPREISLGSLLSSAGYRTQMLGKWHCGDQAEFLPTNHGFDHYLGLPYSNDMGRQAAPPGEHKFDLPPLPLLSDDKVIEEQPDQAALTERYVDAGVEFMRSAVEADQPFFMYLAHLYVHVPLYVKEQFAEQSDNGSYGAAVEAIDWATGAIVDELDKLGIADNTIVIFTSDNGSRAVDGGSNLPLRGVKGTTWEGGMRVPFIVRWPGEVEPGRTSDQLATAMDLYPTLANICGAEVPTDRVIDGKDITGVLTNPSAASPHEAFYYYWMNDLEAVRVGDWKLHLSKHTSPQHDLYDLRSDPSETRNLYDDCPDVVSELQAHVEAARKSLGDALTNSEGTDIRAIGQVENPKPLTTYDPNHPYFMAEYDLTDRG